MAGKKQWPDSETIVEDALKERPKEFKFKHAEPSDLLDEIGSDFIVKVLRYAIAEPVQVKTSNNGETLGVILPLPDPLPGRFRRRFSERMRKHVIDHSNKHLSVRILLFVARAGEKKSVKDIKEEICREINFIFKILKQRKKGK